MRVALPSVALALVAAPVFASAQTPAETHEAFLYQALLNYRKELAKSDVLKLELIGTETVGTAVKSIHSTLYWRLSTDSRTGLKSKVEFEAHIFSPTPTGEQITMRIVGDGVNLYRYDLVRSEVATVAYGFYTPTPPANYVGTDAPKLYTVASPAVPGVPSYLLRVLRELNPIGDLGTVRFSSWMPGFAPKFASEIAGLSSTPTDPIIPTRAYPDSIPGVQYVLYGVNVPSTRRTVAFELADQPDADTPDVPRWMLSRIYFADRSYGRLVDFSITPSVAPLLPSYAFQPLRGAAAAGFKVVPMPKAAGS